MTGSSNDQTGSAFNHDSFAASHITPRFLPQSTWLEHIPFAMSLIEMAKPQILVELGTQFGASYCAFCQAVQALQLPTKCFAVDTWVGDKHTGEYGTSALARLRAHHDPLYGSFSSLMPMTFDEAVQSFADGTIDILHIDGLHTYEAVSHDFETWRPRLSTRAVVLFHDVNEHGNNFGIWRFWDEIKSQFPSFQFQHEHGLGIAAVGPECPDALRHLFGLSADEQDRIRAYYEKRGKQLRNLQAHQTDARDGRFYASRTTSVWYDPHQRHFQFLLRQSAGADPGSKQIVVQQGRWAAARSRRLRRLQELSATSTAVLRTEGVVGFARRVYRWLILGERQWHVPALVSPVPRRYSSSKSAYQRHIQLTEPTDAELAVQRERAHRWLSKPAVQIVSAIQNDEALLVSKTIDSVRAQTYEFWNWLICTTGNDDAVDEVLLKAAADPRIRVCSGDQASLADVIDETLQQNSDGYVLTLTFGDVLAPSAIYSAADAIRNHPEINAIYGDHDYLDKAGQRHDPFYKPDWSPEMLYGVNYPGPTMVRRSLFNFLEGGASMFAPERDWELALKIAENTSEVMHSPDVLCHRHTQHPQADLYDSHSAMPGILDQHLRRLGIHKPAVSCEPATGGTFLAVRWEPQGPHFVSIVIPTKDNTSLLSACLESIYKHTLPDSFEIILVDTGSRQPETQALYKKFRSRSNFRLTHSAGEFNFSRACNQGANQASGDLLMFMNNDIEVTDDHWLDRLAQWFDLEGVGVVGPKLLYPNGMIQHGGTIVGWNGTAAHLFIGEQEGIHSMIGSDQWYRNVLAVSGASLMIPHDLFDQLDGFDPAFQLLYSDTDLCLRAHDMGRRIVYTPDVRLIHHESRTRDRAVIPRADLVRAGRQWAKWLRSGDPYYNPNLSYQSSTPAFMQGGDLPDLLHQNLLKRLPDHETFVFPDQLL